MCNGLTVTTSLHCHYSHYSSLKSYRQFDLTCINHQCHIDAPLRTYAHYKSLTLTLSVVAVDNAMRDAQSYCLQTELQPRDAYRSHIISG